MAFRSLLKARRPLPSGGHLTQEGQLIAPGRTKAEYRDAGGRTVCFGTLPPWRPKLPKGTPVGKFGGVSVKLRWDKLGDKVAGILFLSHAAVEAVKKMPGFEAV